MKKREFIERIASGLRNMEYTPDYLLINAYGLGDWCWDEYFLCGIPVIKGHIGSNVGYGGEDYPIIPCFKDLEEERIPYQVILFQRGLNDYESRKSVR